MTLRAHIVVARGSLNLDVWLNAAPGEVVAVLGPNGAGKTTILRCLAGLLAIERGSIAIAGEVVDDPAAGVFVRSELRSCGVMFQQYLLFPHMSVLENVSFGLRARGVDKASAHDEARDWLSRVGIEGFDASRPSTRSPEVRRSESRWLAPSHPNRGSCCSTSRLRRSMRRRGWRCVVSCAGTSPGSPGRQCS